MVLVTEMVMLISLSLAKNAKRRHMNFVLIGMFYILTECLDVVTGIGIPLEIHSSRPAISILSVVKDSLNKYKTDILHKFKCC